MLKAEVELRVSQDGMEVIGAPAQDAGNAVSVASGEDLQRALAEMGVVQGVDEGAIEGFVKALAGGVVPSVDLVLARGQRPVPGKSARVEFGGRTIPEDELPAHAVAPGEMIATVTPASEGRPGKDVFGNEAPPPPAVERTLSAGDHVAVSEDGCTFTAETHGVPRLIDDVLSLIPLVTVTPDGLEAWVYVRPDLKDGQAPSLALVRTALEQAGVCSGVDEAAIEEAVASEPLPDRVLAAAGRAPQLGTDGRIVLHFTRFPSAGTPIEGTDRIDYRERGTLQNVRAGAVLATRVPPTAGQDGEDVHGNALPAAPGEEQELTAVEGAALSEDGNTYYAERDGVVSLAGEDRLGVYPYFEIPGDVDYETGNLTMAGSLKVNGWIRAGFTVRTEGDLIVTGGIEAAVVEVGGNLVVNGGIVGDEETVISARGDVHAAFMERTVVRAGGGVLVRDGALHSLVSAEGPITVLGGKGRIIGGDMHGVAGIRARDTGCDAAIETRVSAGLDAEVLERMARLQKEIALYRRNKRKVAVAMAQIGAKAKVGGLGASDRLRLGKLAKFQRAGAANEARLRQLQRLLLNRAGGEGPPSITVDDKVYEGTLVCILGARMRVRDTYTGGGVFALNPATWKIQFTG